MLPQVAVIGAGPAGLLAAILLAQRGLDICVFEQTKSIPEWDSRSYSINLNQRGLSSLQHAGLLDQVQERALVRRKVIFRSGDQENVMERNPPHYAITRSSLNELLTDALRYFPNVEIHHDVKMQDLNYIKETKVLELSLSNGELRRFSHVIGADGKWSSVRNCAPFKDAGDYSKMYKFEEIKEKSWGISLGLTRFPEHFENSLYVLKPRTPQLAMYIMLAPLCDGTASLSWVLYNEILDSYPWLQPLDDTTHSWNDAIATKESLARAKDLLKNEFPFLQDAGIVNDISGMNIGKRASWIRVEHRLNACNDRVVLIGDAGHSMTPSIGEGCNCALESAALLSKAIAKQSEEQKLPFTTEIVDRAFKEFGESRLKGVFDVQMRSALASRSFNSK